MKVPTLIEQSGLAAALAVTDVKDSHDQIAISNGAVAAIEWPEGFWRTDIGARAPTRT